jgi:hypothetical protein
LASREHWTDRGKPISDLWESIVISGLPSSKHDGEADREAKKVAHEVTKAALYEVRPVSIRERIVPES